MTEGQEGKLSKEEVEALLQATREEEPPPERPEPPARRVHGYDFLQPSRFNKSQLESLRKINDGLAQNAALQASRLLRSNVKAQLVSMDQMKWENLLDEQGEAALGFAFGMEPLGCRGVMTFEKPFAALCLDRLLGGAGGAVEEIEELTELDRRVLSHFYEALLHPLPEVWANIGEFQLAFGPFLADLQSSDLFAPDEDLFQLCFLLQSTVGSGQIALSVPFSAVKDLPPKGEDQQQDVAVATSRDESRAALRENLKLARVVLTVLLGSADVKVSRLVRAEPGDVVVLNARIGDMLDVKVNDKVKLRGCPGLSNGKYAVKIVTED
jgi:flagellar motor switch protein FliM